MPFRACRRAIQPGRRTAIAVAVGEDLVDIDIAAYINPPTTKTTRLATGRPFHWTEKSRMSVLRASGMSRLPTLHCENETGHDRALSVPGSVPRSQHANQPESEAFPKRSKSVPGDAPGITICNWCLLKLSVQRCRLAPAPRTEPRRIAFRTRRPRFGESGMPLYVTLAKWTDQGVKNAKDAVTRWEQGSAAMEQAGGRIVGLWWTQGAYDAVGVTEWPDDESASAFTLTTAMLGNVRTETMRAYTQDEMQRIIAKLP